MIRIARVLILQTGQINPSPRSEWELIQLKNRNESPVPGGPAAAIVDERAIHRVYNAKEGVTD